MRRWMWIIVLFMLVFSCTREKEVSIDQLRRQEIDKRVNQFIRNREQSCYENTMNKAIVKADSLLKLRAVKYVEDSLQRPPLPVKPARNIKPIPKDTVKNKPFLD